MRASKRRRPRRMAAASRRSVAGLSSSAGSSGGRRTDGTLGRTASTNGSLPGGASLAGMAGSTPTLRKRARAQAHLAEGIREVLVYVHPHCRITDGAVDYIDFQVPHPPPHPRPYTRTPALHPRSTATNNIACHPLSLLQLFTMMKQFVSPGVHSAEDVRELLMTRLPEDMRYFADTFVKTVRADRRLWA